MSVYVSSLKEDLYRVRRNIEMYQRRISEYPSGSLMIRKIKGHDYIYLKYRKNGKVIQEYVAPFHQDKYDQLSRDIFQRKQLQKELKNLITEEKEMIKALKTLGEKDV